MDGKVIHENGAITVTSYRTPFVWASEPKTDRTYLNTLYKMLELRTNQSIPSVRRIDMEPHILFGAHLS